MGKTMSNSWEKEKVRKQGLNLDVGHTVVDVVLNGKTYVCATSFDVKTAKRVVDLDKMYNQVSKTDEIEEGLNVAEEMISIVKDMLCEYTNKYQKRRLRKLKPKHIDLSIQQAKQVIDYISSYNTKK